MINYQLKPKLELETQNSNTADISKKKKFIGSVVDGSILLRGIIIIKYHKVSRR